MEINKRWEVKINNIWKTGKGSKALKTKRKQKSVKLYHFYKNN